MLVENYNYIDAPGLLLWMGEFLEISAISLMMRWSSGLFCLWVGCCTCYLQKFVSDILFTSLFAGFSQVFFDGLKGLMWSEVWGSGSSPGLVLGRFPIGIFLI